MSRKLPYYLSAVFLALFGVSALAQEQAAVIEPQQAPTTEQQPVYAEQPAEFAEQPAAAEPQPIYAEQAYAGEQTAAASDSVQVQPYIEPAPAYEPPQQTYVQGYGKPPEGFYGYFGYPPPSENANAGCCCRGTDSTAQTKQKEKDYKSLQSFNISIPIQSETYGLKSPDYDVKTNHFGVGINWNRIRVEKSLYSSVVGLGANYIMSEWDGGGKKDIKFNGLDANFKFGFGVSPLTERFILAIHAIFVFDYKLQNAVFKKKIGDYEMFKGLGLPDEISNYNLERTLTAHNLDLELGGDLVIGYQFTNSFGVLAGVDITTNMIGVGALLSEGKVPDGLKEGVQGLSSSVYSKYPEEIAELEAFDEGDDIKFFLYNVTGLNIVPRIGIFFAF